MTDKNESRFAGGMYVESATDKLEVGDVEFDASTGEAHTIAQNQYNPFVKDHMPTQVIQVSDTKFIIKCSKNA